MRGPVLDEPLHHSGGQYCTRNYNPIEPKAFSRHWYDCLRALGIRQRGMYCMKDTFVTMALSVGVKIAWLEAQTGVAYETLRRHYGRWMPFECVMVPPHTFIAWPVTPRAVGDARYTAAAAISSASSRRRWIDRGRMRS